MTIQRASPQAGGGGQAGYSLLSPAGLAATATTGKARIVRVKSSANGIAAPTADQVNGLS